MVCWRTSETICGTIVRNDQGIKPVILVSSTSGSGSGGGGGGGGGVGAWPETKKVTQFVMGHLVNSKVNMYVFCALNQFIGYLIYIAHEKLHISKMAADNWAKNQP